MILSSIDRSLPAARSRLLSSEIRAQFAAAADDIEGLLLTGAATPTGSFRAGDGARILRLNDRLFLGAATANDGAAPNVAKDWLTDLIVWPVYNATSAILSPNGHIALTVGSQTLGFDPVAAGTTQTTIGLASFAVANNPGTFPDDFFSAYAFYGEGITYPGTVSNAFAAELEAINVRGADDPAPTPWRELTLSAVHALRLGSGGGQPATHTPNHAQTAISIVDNGAKFQAGIVFGRNSLVGADGTTGFGTAVAMARGHLLSWFGPGTGDGERTTFITSTATQPVDSLQFQNGGLLLVSPAGKITTAFDVVPSAVNGVKLTPAILGSSPSVGAFGDNTNVNLGLRTKGTGHIEVFAPSMLFYSSGGSQLAGLVNNTTDPARMTTLQFSDDGAFLFSSGGGVLMSFSRVAGSVNSVSVFPAVAGSAPSIRAQGTDTNIDLMLQGQGTGTINLQTPTTTSASVGGASAIPGAPAGWSTIKINGTAQKVPYWNV
jgi:hypothetical protein